LINDQIKDAEAHPSANGQTRYRFWSIMAQKINFFARG